MGGASLQLNAYGEQDKMLTGTLLNNNTRNNPNMSFFKYVYRKHTNFAIEQVEHIIENSKSLEEYKGISTLSSRTGDLVTNCIIKMEFTAGVTMDNKDVSTNYLTFTNNTGHAYLKDVEIRIGEQMIDKHYSLWLDIWNELTDKDFREHTAVNKHSAKLAYYKGTKNSEETNPNNYVKYIEADDTLTCYVPLKFWFNRNPGLALPLIALQHHTVKLHMTFRKMSAIFNSNTTFSEPNIIPEVNVIVDYVFLDGEERRKFAMGKHKYLIEQLQYQGAENLTTRHNLTFNHPVKEIIWVCQNRRASTEGDNPSTNGSNFDGTINLSSSESNFGASWGYNDYFNYSSPDRSVLTEVIGGSKSYECFNYARLQINGIDRIEKQRPSYFRICQPMTHHTKIPNKHIYTYSFALYPEEYQPSGTCNFSMLNSAHLVFDSVSNSEQLMDINIFAINYNELCIMNGMGALRYNT
jgi:hypothetical protein